MKKIAFKIAILLTVFTALGFFLDATLGENTRKELRFGKSVRAQKGKTIMDAKLVLGEPFMIDDMKRYKDRLPSLANSLEPDPPLIECDKVYSYQEIATIGLLFIRNDVVIDVYVGGT